jgi:PAS domain S-box-containing protein
MPVTSSPELYSSSAPPSFRPVLLRFGLPITGGLALAIGASWLVAWFLGVAAQWSTEGVITVKTNMALGQLLAGVALLLLGPASVSRKRRWAGGAAAVLVLLIGALTLSEHLFHANLGIDQLLATEAPGAAATASPNRMSFPGSSSLALLGAGLLALALQWRRIVPYFGLAVCLINLLPAVGYLYGIDKFYDLPRAGIAWPTVVALISLGLGLVLARSDGGPTAMLLGNDLGSILLRRLLPAMLLIPLVLGLLRIQGERLGLYGSATGSGLLAISVAVLFSLLLWPTAGRLSRLATEEAAARQKLRESEQRWVTTLASIGDAVMATDASGNITFMNEVAEALSEWPRQEAIGRPVNEVFRVENELTGTAMENPAMTVLRLNRVVEVANHAAMIGRRGGRIPVDDSAAPIRDAAGIMTGVVLVFRDVTERRAKERERAEALQREQAARQMAEDTASRLRKIEMVAETALAHLPLERMLRRLLHRVAEALQTDMAAILLLNEKTQMLEVRAALGLEEEVIGKMQIPLGKGVAGTIAQTGQLRIVEKLADADVFNPVLSQKAASLMGAPLVVEGRIIGVLHVDSKTPRKFTDAEAALLQVVADRVALTIDRKRAEEALLKSKELLDRFVQEAPVSLAMFDRNMRYLQVSNRWLAETGLPETERNILGKTHYEVFPNLPDHWKEMHRRGLAGESVKAGDDWVAADGQTHSINWEIHPWGDSGTETGGIIISFEDVTERKQAEQRIAHLASFPELNVNPIFEADLEGRITYTNPAAQQRFPELMKNATDHPLLQEWTAVVAALGNGDELTLAREIEMDGAVFRQDIHSVPEGKFVRAYHVDITERKQMEEALRASEERWSTTLQSIGDAVISTCAQGKVVFMNDVAQKLTGWRLAEAQGKDLDEVFNIIQEVTRTKPESPVSKVLRLGRVVGLANHTVLIRRDGAETPIDDSAAPILGREGKIEGVVLVFHDVTEQRQAEQALRSHAELLRLSFDAVIVWRLEGGIESWNLGAERLYGFTEKEAFGSFTHELLATVHPKPWPEIEAELRARGSWEGELCDRTRDGREVVVSARKQLIRGSDGIERVLETNRDITERKQMEEALRASEERWATTLQSIGDAVISTNAAGKITFMNDVAQKLTGWPLAEAAGKELRTIFNIVQEVTRRVPENPVSKVLRLGKVVGLANHTLLIQRDGNEIPIDDSGAPIRSRDDKIEGVVLVFHDVTEQRKTELALRNSERLATTGRLAASIAHEIHNPLDAIGNLLYLLQQNNKDETAREYIAMALQESARVVQMTKQMLSFQREAAKPVQVKIGEVLDSVVALYQRKIDSAGIKLENRIDYEGEFLAQPGEIRQIFANLLGNAIEASNRGRIRLHAYPGRDWSSGRRGLRVVVADNGPGIPPEVRGKIFEPFFTTKGESGTGLGLWITSGIVEKYEGAVRLRSTTRAGRSGTCFSVFFPFPVTTNL